jgi:hypothetical protein
MKLLLCILNWVLSIVELKYTILEGHCSHALAIFTSIEGGQYMKMNFSLVIPRCVLEKLGRGCTVYTAIVVVYI